jgi:uncharacterized membrane protein YfcA
MKNFLASLPVFVMTNTLNVIVFLFSLFVSDRIIPDGVPKGVLVVFSVTLILFGVIIWTMKQNVDIQKIRHYQVVGNLISVCGLLWLISVVVWYIKPHIIPMFIFMFIFYIGYLESSKHEDEKESRLN